MARRSRRKRAPSGAPGWIQTAVGAFVLLGVGFGVGLVAGGALEEPELVARHVAGETVEAPLPSELPGAGTGDPLASALARVEAAGEGERPLGAPAPAPTPAASERTAEAPAPVAAVPDSPAARERGRVASKPPPVASAPASPAAAATRTGFSVQVGAFSEDSGASRLVERLQALGFSSYVAEVDIEGRAGARYRVRVGPFPTREAASDAAARLHAEERLPTWVLAEEGA